MRKKNVLHYFLGAPRILYFLKELATFSCCLCVCGSTLYYAAFFLVTFLRNGCSL
jgi:hypothetical protein